jgi:hypothetical protein
MNVELILPELCFSISRYEFLRRLLRRTVTKDKPLSAGQVSVFTPFILTLTNSS